MTLLGRLLLCTWNCQPDFQFAPVIYLKVRAFFPVCFFASLSADCHPPPTGVEPIPSPATQGVLLWRQELTKGVSHLGYDGASLLSPIPPLVADMSVRVTALAY